MSLARMYNIRGCNGSGKTTLVRSLFDHVRTEVRSFGVEDHKPIPVTFGFGTVLKFAAIGDYLQSGCAGLDRVRTQAAAKGVILKVRESCGENLDFILFEGVLVSTIFEPWLKFSRDNGGVTWAFLDTPLKTCLDRIQARNGGVPIKEDQVGDKHSTIRRIQDKARQAGERVLVLPYANAKEWLVSDMRGRDVLEGAQL